MNARRDFTPPVSRGVTVTVDGERIVDIETRHLSGAPMTSENEGHVLWAIRHLAGFIGLPAITEPPRRSFQDRVHAWVSECFGEKSAYDRTERTHRFLEESIELAQALGCTEAEVMQLVRYVYSRPAGEVAQEIGGAMVTLAALCAANSCSMGACGEQELARVLTRIDEIRAKQARKPKSAQPAAT